MDQDPIYGGIDPQEDRSVEDQLIDAAFERAMEQSAELQAEGVDWEELEHELYGDEGVPLDENSTQRILPWDHDPLDLPEPSDEAYERIYGPISATTTVRDLLDELENASDGALRVLAAWHMSSVHVLTDIVEGPPRGWGAALDHVIDELRRGGERKLARKARRATDQYVKALHAFLELAEWYADQADQLVALIDER